jgi:putative ABC transport system permease protein
MRQLLTESAALALAGGALGLALAWWLPPVLVRALGAGDLIFDPRPDLSVLAHALSLSSLSALLFGLAPALVCTRVELISALKDLHLDDRRRGSLLQAGLVAGQVAGCVVLVVLCGLLLRAVNHAATADPGFSTSGVIAFSFDLREQGYDDQRAAAFHRQLSERLLDLEGVEAVATAGMLPLFGRQHVSITVGDVEAHGVASNLVSPGYFRTMGMRVVRGRTFTDDEARASDPRPAIVSEAMVQRYWPGSDGVGRRFRSGPTYEVVGVTADAQTIRLGEIDGPVFYAPDSGSIGARLIVRAPGRTAAIAAAVPTLARGIDGDVLVEVQPIEAVIARILQPVRTTAFVCALLGLFALLLAAVGVYGVVRQNLSRRTREMGVRMALGAQPREIVALAVRQGARPVVVGMAAGLLLATAGSGVMRGLLFGISPLDPVAYLGTVTFLAAAALVALYLPARRAARVDPAVTLRLE